MQKVNRIFAAGLLACGLSLGFGGFCQAQDTPPPPPQYQQITPEQWAEAQKIFNENYAGMENTRQELAYKRQLLDQHLSSPNPDRNAIEQLSREIGELRGKMLASRVEARNRLAERGLPADCYGPCNGYYPMGMMGYDMMGPYYGGRHHGHGYRHGRGGWGCPGWRW